LHLKKTVRGARRVLRGRSVTLVRQEAWALLLVRNMIAAIAAQAASGAGLDPGALSFTAVLSLVRSHAIADTCCRHCGKRPASADDPLAPLTTAILARPRDRTGRKRTSGRTPAERQEWRTEEATTPSRSTRQIFRKQTHVPEVKGSGCRTGPTPPPIPRATYVRSWCSRYRP
jgi:hypothetical protein